MPGWAAWRCSGCASSRPRYHAGRPPATLAPAALPAALDARLAAMPEGPLRDALAKLAQGVYRTAP